MKRIFFYSLCIVAVFILLQGCSESDDIFLNIDRTELTFIDGNAQSITINTSEEWSIHGITFLGSAQWFMISPVNGSPGEHLISVTPFGPNVGMTDRTGGFEITAGGITRRVELRQNKQTNIAFSPNTIEIPPAGGTSNPVKLAVNANWTFELVTENDFEVTYSINPPNTNTPGTYTLTFSASQANEGFITKNAEFIVRSEGMEAAVAIRQEGTIINPSYVDKEVVYLQESDTRVGVNLLLMGDGFTSGDMNRGGRYEQVMTQAMEHFFDIEPFRSYRGYFNVRMMVAISQQAGVGNFQGEINNAFGSYYGEGTLVNFDFEKCKRYALEAFQGSSVQEGDITVGLILNSTKYAGTTTIQGNGFSIARCPMSSNPAPNDFKGVLQHELGGHGFIRAADEYVYSNSQIPADEIANTRTWQNLGAYSNVDFTNNLSNILWRDFIGLPRYANVGAYEGALTYGRGVWRPEINSCMNNNVPYYNGPTRWRAVDRIMRIIGNTFTFERFIEFDVIDQNAQNEAKTRAYDSSMPPLHPPILIE